MSEHHKNTANGAVWCFAQAGQVCTESGAGGFGCPFQQPGPIGLLQMVASGMV